MRSIGDPFVLAARLDRLDAEGRAVIERGAVEGRSSTRARSLSGSIHMLERAVEIATGERRARALVELGERLEDIGDYQRCVDVLDAFLASADAETNRALAARARVFNLVSHSMTDPDLACRKATGEEMAVRAGVLVCATMGFFRGQCGESREIAARLLPDVSRMDPRSPKRRDVGAQGERRDHLTDAGLARGARLSGRVPRDPPLG